MAERVTHSCASLARLATIACVALALAACSGSHENTTMKTTHTTQLTRAEWDAAAARSVFFGHQSVGDNMLDGLRQISESESWPALRILEQNGGAALRGPVLLHAKIGQNGDPRSKVKAFREAIDAGLGNQVDIALMKFCFWDIRHETDIDAVFNEYRSTMDDLARRYPKVTFVHTTVPLVAADVDWKAQVRRLIGLTTPTDIDNRTREKLNQRIRSQYAGHVLLDIAMAEREPSGPSDAPQLAASLSSDGAHLNNAGRLRVGAEFVKALSEASSRVRAN